MANFNFTLDTQEMADSIDGVSSRVTATTTAVVAMQTAVIAAENAAANRICKNVDKGFFSLIRAQITQKIARLRSEVDSRFIEMRQQSQALTAIRIRMERDYQMISNRYARVFRSIDLSLRNRVFELDKAVSVFVSREVEHIQIRLRSLQAQSPLHQLESVPAVQVVAASQVKADAHRAIGAMHRFLSESSRQAALLESMLCEKVDETSGIRYVPVLLVESESMSAGAAQWEIRTPRNSARRMAENVDAGAQSAVFASLQSLKWKAPDAEFRARVGGDFRQMVGQAGLNPRVQSNMLRLFESSAWTVMGSRP